MKKLLFFLFSFLYSCAGAKYDLNVGVEKSNFKDVRGNDSESKTGFHIGITESTKYIISTLNYSRNEFDIDTDTKSYKNALFGIDGSIGLNIRYVKPRYTFARYTLAEDDGDEKNSGSYNVTGPGVMFSVPISSSIYLYLTYDSLEARNVIEFNGSAKTFDFTRTMLGFRYYIGSVGQKNSED